MELTRFFKPVPGADGPPNTTDTSHHSTAADGRRATNTAPTWRVYDVDKARP